MKREQRLAYERLCAAYAPPLDPLHVRLVRTVRVFWAMRKDYGIRYSARVAWQIGMQGSPF